MHEFSDLLETDASPVIHALNGLQADPLAHLARARPLHVERVEQAPADLADRIERRLEDVPSLVLGEFVECEVGDLGGAVEPVQVGMVQRSGSVTTVARDVVGVGVGDDLQIGRASCRERV